MAKGPRTLGGCASYICRIAPWLRKVGVPPAKTLAAPSRSGFACSGLSVTLVGVTLGPHPWLLAEDRGYVDGWQRLGYARKRQLG